MKVALIIPCRNEQANIEECIDAIYSSNIDVSIEMQVYVVDGMSDDNTIPLLKKLQASYPSLTIIENTKQLTPFAFNLGIYAGGDCDYFQIIGARQIISENYLQSAISKLESDPSIWCIGGRVENVYLNETGRIIAAAMETTFGMGLGNFRTLETSGFVDTVGTPMYPKRVFDEIGYFDEELIRNQDDDFNFRVTNAGGKIFFDASISLKYYVRGNFKGLWKQFFQYGYWKVFVNKKHKAITTFRQLIPPLFVFYLLCLVVSLFLPFIPISFKAIGLLPLFFYSALALTFALKSSEESKTPLLKTAITFPILHVSYGLGYLKGIWNFLILGKKPSEKSKELSR